jgi:hypothetical protein
MELIMNQMMFLRRHDGIDRKGHDRISPNEYGREDNGGDGSRDYYHGRAGNPVRLRIDFSRTNGMGYWLLANVQIVRLMLIAIVIAVMVTIVLE